VNTIKTASATHVNAVGETADDREVMRITSQIMVEYSVTLEALAKSEAEDRVTTKPINSK
jgi:hypothetical protein